MHKNPKKNYHIKHLSKICEVATFRKGVRAIQLVGRASELLIPLCMINIWAYNKCLE